jgi:hypothetical protein
MIVLGAAAILGILDWYRRPAPEIQRHGKSDSEIVTSGGAAAEAAMSAALRNKKPISGRLERRTGVKRTSVWRGRKASLVA